MSVIILKDEMLENEVMNADKPVLIDFFATWCGPCRMVSPIVDEIAEEHSEFKICKVNVDEEPELAQKFGVVSIPTLVVIRDGKVTGQSVGAKPKEDILEMLRG
ncbi:MAG: thioredoxin [Oscillospiraceae bacterium]|jgi:thioredoxin|nr:MAG: thioredoxin [Oscillospiraceae bacterium]